MKDEKNLLAIKCACLDMELDKKANHAHKLNYVYGDETAKNAFIDEFGEEWYKISINLVRARDKRKKRVFDHLQGLVNDLKVDFYFLTLTFTDKVLASTTAPTRRRYVSRWLKKYSGIYIANIDFGKDNGREHYHAIACQRVSNEARKAWKYGSINFRIVKTTEVDRKSVCKYLVKLTNHALKSSTYKNGSSPRLIYSKSLYRQFNFSEVF